MAQGKEWHEEKLKASVLYVQIMAAKVPGLLVRDIRTSCGGDWGLLEYIQEREGVTLHMSTRVQEVA